MERPCPETDKNVKHFRLNVLHVPEIIDLVDFQLENRANRICISVFQLTACPTPLTKAESPLNYETFGVNRDAYNLKFVQIQCRKYNPLFLEEASCFTLTF